MSLSTPVALAPPATAPESPPLPLEELNRLHREDYGAAAMIVCIMGTVFTVGLLLYLFIAFLALGGSS